MKKLNLFLLTSFIIFSLSSCSDKSESDGMYSPTGGGNISVSGERYNEIEENQFEDVATKPVSTFAIDADGGSYSNVRRFINSGQKPPLGAIRTEELINFFTYNYNDPNDGQPVGVNGEVSQCPWDETHKLIRIGLKGKSYAHDAMPAANIVLLVDVSGSMGSADKLPLLKESFKLLVNQFRSQDKIAIVTYAGSAGVVLQATPGNEKDKINSAIDKLGAGGSTAGAQGIITAYEIAGQNFVKGGNNRVILASDGDFNVGPSSQAELIKLIEEKRDKGIFLTVLGVGTGNLNDAAMEQIADHGNGNYEYIDNIEQGRKVFVDEYSKFLTVAKDVKVQVEFNPSIVKSYRLIGYENRMLEKEDFTNDKKDAGEIGAGQTITALYEIVPESGVNYKSAPTFTIDFRYKNPDEDASKALKLEITDSENNFASASEDIRFAASLAGFGMLLRNSQFKGSVTYDNLHNWASGARSFNPNGLRNDFIQLIDKAKTIK